MSLRYPFFRIGIIGGGQLAKMMTQEAKRMGFWVAVLDPTPQSPAGQVSDREIIADFYDSEALTTLAQEVDVVTYDIEHVDVHTLQKEAIQTLILPSPELLAIIQDKLVQKEVLRQGGIPIPRFSPEVHRETLEELGLPAVWKARFGGYDGRGVARIQSAEDLSTLPPKPAFLEEHIDIAKELAVLVARNRQGEMAVYPVVEMTFHTHAHICNWVIAPADIPLQIAERARSIAERCVLLLEGVGIFAVEMFLTTGGELFVNEIAPRPHNSGHFTIEACVTSQFEQHLRAICDLPLGATDLLSPAVMVNLLGGEGYQGTPVLTGLTEALRIPGVSFHFYGKRETRPLRKMGHVTIVDQTREGAMEKARRVQNILKIHS